jgi:peroxiredoxin
MSRVRPSAKLVVAVLSLIAVCPLCWGAEGTRVGRKIESFELRDFYGKVHKLDDFNDHKLLVVAFLGTDCPLVKLYTPRLVELAEEFKDKNVAFIGINSNHQDTVTEINAFAQRNKVNFPILKDPDNAVADRFVAVRTPEVFVLDQNRVVRYWGRIDDQFGIGYQKNEPGRRDLAEALNELLAGKQVSIPTVTAPGCLIGRTQKIEPRGDVTYTNQISRIMQNRCIECHREGEIAPFPLTSYDEVVGWADMICEVIDEGRMPPWFANPKYGKFANDCRMSDEEKQLVHTWVANGCPEGDDKDLPADRQFTQGWRIGEPDAVYYMSKRPVKIPAEGVVDYMHFEVDPGFTEDKWIQAAEARPGNAAVVHHIIVFIRSPDNGSFGGFSEGAQIGYAPGMPPRDLPPGQAMRIPAGSKLAFQMHYTPVGTPQEDLSYVGFKFADPATVKHRVKGSVCGNVTFEIPPGDPNYEVKARKRFRRDTLLVSLLPHMHVRGKDFLVELEYPDGTRETLLDVPKYDFNWQLWYNYAEPKLIPKGSRIHCTAHFDNSEENPFNPDPTKKVTWGEQTWEEMMFGFMSVIDPAEDINHPVEDDDDDDGAGGEATRRAAF